MRFKTAVTGLLCGLILASPAARAASASDARDRAVLEKTLLDDGASGPMMRELKQEFPDSFNELLDKLVALKGDPDARSKAAALGYDVTHRLSQSHLMDAASAPDDKINDFLASQVLVIQSLRRENVAVCAKFFAGGMPKDPSLSPRSMSLLSDVVLALMHAIRAGIDHPTARPELSSGDVEALRQALKAAHVRDELVSAVLTEGGLNKLSEADQCEVSFDFYAALASLPPAVEARWGATILAASKQPS